MSSPHCRWSIRQAHVGAATVVASQELHRHPDVERGADAGGHPRREQQVTTQLEEVVLRTDAAWNVAVTGHQQCRDSAVGGALLQRRLVGMVDGDLTGAQIGHHGVVDGGVAAAECAVIAALDRDQ